MALIVTNLISVVTPVYRPVARYISEAYESLRAQNLPPNWDWQWLVQEDGQTGEIATMLPDDPRISVGSGRRSGDAIARNMCLSRATGDLIKVLDADDQLTPGALRREIDVFTQYPEVGWTTARALDLHEDGSTAGFDHNPPAGQIQPGDVLRHWRSHNYRASVHPATLCVRRDLLFALGGWMALPASGDTGLLLALNVVSLGYFIPEIGLLYRKWPGQMTSQPSHYEHTEWSARMKIIGERADALSALWQSAPSRRQPLNGRKS